jgi:hypothetical protein
MRNQDQGWGYQGPVISGSQAPLGTQGTSEISGISLNQDQGWGYQVLALISRIQHSSDNGTCWPLLPVPSTSAAAATARCCCMTRVGAPRVCVAQHRRRQHGPPRPAPAPRRFTRTGNGKWAPIELWVHIQSRPARGPMHILVL